MDSGKFKELKTSELKIQKNTEQAGDGLQLNADNQTLTENISGTTLASEAVEVPSFVVKKFRDSTEKSMPEQVNDLQSSTRERLMEEKNRLKERNATGQNETVKPAALNYDELQEALWKTVADFHNTADVKTAMGVKYNRFDDKDLFALRDELRDDTDRKTEGFMDMYNAVDTLLSLSQANGKIKEEGKPEVTKDFNEVLFTAQVQVNKYIKDHSGFRWTKKGDRRVQVVLRMQTLIKQLQKERDKVQEDMLAKNVRMAGYQTEGLSAEEIEERERAFSADAAVGDMMRLIETGRFVSEGEKEGAKKAGSDWIEKGYTKDIKQMIEASGVAEEDKKRQNEFLAFLVDEENRKVANRMAVSILLDSSKDATLNMPWLKERLNDHLAKKLKDSIKAKTPEFIELAKKEIEEYKKENSEKIAGYKARLEKVGYVLRLPLDSENLFAFSEMKELLSEEDEEAFKDKLRSLKEHVEANDKIILDMLTERYSVRTRSSIQKKMMAYLGALRIFGTAEQIADQSAAFIDMLKFTASAEYIEEQGISEVMDDLKIDKVRKDSFILFMTENDPGKLFNIKAKNNAKRLELYVKNMKTNSKAFDKYVKEENRMLTKEQWDALEELLLKNGEMDEKEFLSRIKETGSGTAEGEKLSRKEYLTDRKFRDAEKEPARQKHLKAELEEIEMLGNTMDSKFLVNINSAKDPMEKYRDLNAAFAGKTKQSKADAEAAKGLREERCNHVNHILQKSGIPRKRWEEFREKFNRHIDGILEIKDDMYADEKAEAQRKNLERFGVKTWDEALQIMEMVVPQLFEGGSKEVEENEKQYEERLKKLSEFDDGKYEDFADILMEIPAVFAAMMSKDEKIVNAFMKEELDLRLKGFIEGVGLAGTRRKEGQKGDNYIIPDAVRKQYAYNNLRRIYDGSLSGDAQFFREDISDYYDRVFKLKPEGSKTIGDNIKEVDKELETKIFFKWKKGGEALGIKIAVLGRIYEMMNNSEEFLTLLDLKALKKFALEELDRVVTNVKKNETETETTAKITEKFKDELPATNDDLLEKLKDIKKQKEQGLKDRRNMLGIDTERLEKVRLGKSLVRVAEKGDKDITEEKNADSMRGRLEKYCSAFELPPILRDALVEEGAADESGGIMSDRKKLQRHAFAMSKLYNLLTQDYKDDPAMSEEEATMYIVRLYSAKGFRSEFDKADGFNIAELRSVKDYANFRKMYAELTAMEKEDSGDADIEREKAELSRDLRTMMVTRIGLLDKDGNTVRENKIEKKEDIQAYKENMLATIKRAREYLNYSLKVKKLIREQIVKDETAKETQSSDHYIDRKTVAVLNFFMSDLSKAVKEGKAFNEKEWEKRINEKYNDKDYWDNMVFKRDSISSEEYKAFEDLKFESTDTEETISKTLKESKNSSKDANEEYEKLDEDQKKLFSLALMVMDIGSIGYGTTGTTELLNASSQKAKNMQKVQEALNKYVSGEGLDIEINYKEAFNKLFSYKEPVAESEETEKQEKKKKEGEGNTENTENTQQTENAENTQGTTEEEEAKKKDNAPGYVFSETAFEKAMQFAKEITAKKLAFGEKDWTRLDDGYSSIITAGVKYDKDKQLKELDSIKGGDYLTVDRVKEKLLEYIKKDNSFITRNLNGIRDRFEKMSQDDMKLFLRIMQERSVLDVSAADDGSGEEIFVDHEKRHALREALSADPDTQAAVMKGFDDPDSCYRVLVNALSFQIRDDINSTGKDLTEDNFAEGALKRKTLADWDLIERAFDFLDEIKEKRTAVYALSHAANYIEQSGNKEAIAENKKLEEKYSKKKEDFRQTDFEEYIKEQAEKDGDEDIKRVTAGYHALTDKEKKLFFKVLARRDLLDISKKNYKSNFFGKKDRDYVNQAERDKLIDKYIENSLEDNIGITLDDNAYYKAMQSLFTSQIDDTEKLSSEKSIEDMIAAERNLFMLRKTAIDWKLFKRALNFVNRSSEELEYAEGNAQLYRGAGNLVDNGRLDMNYSFLRKNFHRTGNQWGRRIANIFERNVKETFKVDTVLNVLVTGISFADVAARKIGLRKTGSLRKGLTWIKDKTSDVNEFIKSKPKEDTIKINAPDVKTTKELTKEEKEEAEKAEKERRENLNYYGHVRDGINNLFEQGIEATDAVADTADFIKDELSGVLADHFESMQFLTPTKEIKAQVDKNNIVEKTIAKEKKGDKKEEEEENKEEQKSAGPKIKNVVKTFQYVAQNAVYGFLNNNFINAKIDEDGDELEQLQNAANEYAGEEFDKTVKEMVGEDTAKKILDFEKGYYDVKNVIGGYISKTVKCINYAKKCVKHVENIASSVLNINLLKDGQNVSKEKREEDDNKLKEAKETRLDESQSKKAEDIVNKHRGMTSMSKELGVRLEEFNIAGEVVNLSMETASMAGGKLNVGQEAIARAIQEGLQFALFALRIASDRNVLSEYFLKTEAGKAVVDKARNGIRKSGNEEMEKKLDESIKTQEKFGSSSFIDILSDTRGYEHTSELVENTAMSMAQSIVFCASNYNPMAETRLMAITVMSVMGLDKEIGSTEPATVEKLFRKFNMAR